MSRDRKIRYSIRFDNFATGIAWSRKDMGTPSYANLVKVHAHYNASLKPGGCNDHLNLKSTGGAVLVDHQPKPPRVIATFGGSKPVGPVGGWTSHNNLLKDGAWRPNR